MALLLCIFLLATSACYHEPVSDDVTIVVFGDSLTSGYQLASHEAFPNQLEKSLHSMGYKGVKVKNESVPGDTTLGGLYRIRNAMRHNPDIIIIALGANDLLRQISIRTIETNMAHLVEQLRADGAQIVIAGVDSPAFRLGFDYTNAETTFFNRVAERYEVTFYPNILQDISGSKTLLKEDGLHPNAAGVKMMAKNMAPELVPLIHKSLTRLDR